MKQELGIIIAYPPMVLTNSEGLSRLLTFLIQGCLDSGIKIVLICPEWTRKDLEIMFADTNLNILEHNILIKSTGNHYPILLFKAKYDEIKKQKLSLDYLKRFFFLIKEVSTEYFTNLIATRSPFVFMIGILFMFIISPIIICMMVIFIFIYTWGILGSKIRNTNSYKTTAAPFLKRTLEVIGGPLASYKSMNLAQKIFEKMNYQECLGMSKIALNYKSIDSWIITTPYWSNLIKMLPQSIVVCPDSIINDYPIAFSIDDSNDNLIKRRDIIEESLNKAQKIVTYSQYVKESQIKKYYNISDEKISIIPHGHISLTESLSILKPFENLNETEKKSLCLQIIHDYLKKHGKTDYIKSFNFSGLKFLIYSSQIRPHKNIIGLIRAFYLVLHEKNQPIKLILTGRADEIDYTSKVIAELGLKRDVICLPGLPSSVLAALNHLAILSVNPSFFEGGFPFTFSEAYSVGTPSVMSAIPMVEEQVSDFNLRKKMLFNPYQVTDMADKIFWGINNRENLFQLEYPLYEELKSRSWARVAQDYLNLLK